jgi:hypothetical protein
MGSINPVPAAPIKQRVRLLAAVIEDGLVGYKSTIKVFVPCPRLVLHLYFLMSFRDKEATKPEIIPWNKC